MTTAALAAQGRRRRWVTRERNRSPASRLRLAIGPRSISPRRTWMRERYSTLPLGYVGHSFGGQALGLLANNADVSRALLIAAQAAYWRLLAFPERYRVFALLN